VAQPAPRALGDYCRAHTAECRWWGVPEACVLIQIELSSNRLVDLRPQAKECLGWEPKVALREGLASMVDDFKRRLHLEE